MPEPAESPRATRLYAPLAPAALGLAVGIILDRFATSPPTALWLAISLVFGIIAFFYPRAWMLLIVYAALGGARHHLSWSDRAPNDLSLGDWAEPKPCWIRGTIVDGPYFRPSDSPGDTGSTRVLVDVVGVHDHGLWRSAAGRLSIFVNGDRRDLICGSPVYAAGTLGAILGPKNPGESDRRSQMLAEGIRLRMSVADPEGVWADPEGESSRLYLALGWARSRSQAVLISGLDPDVSALGAALLLGRREAVDPDLNDAFARTGTTHLLAISGLHLQALGWVLFGVLLRIGVSWRWSFGLVLLATIGYGALVGFTPSVSRSVAMTVLVCTSCLCSRGSSMENRLAFAAVCTLLLNPSALFDAGCQLSFLAVMALFWGVPALFPYKPLKTPDEHATPKARIDALEQLLEPSWKTRLRRFGTLFLEAIVTSFVVWLAALPLVAFRFHTIAPIGVLLNLPLIPITTIALCCAGVTLATSLLWVPLSYPSSWLGGLMLRWTMNIVNWGVEAPAGWTFTPGPSLAETVTFYGLLSLAAWAVFRGWWIRRWLWVGLAIQSLILAIGVLTPHKPPTVEAEILAVDHGLSVLIQSTDGRVIVYDCGKMRDPKVGRRIIAPALWFRGVSRIETVILSHADSDHYNGLPDLLDRFAIGEVRIPPGFGGARNPEADRLLNRVRAKHIPIREIASGDQIALAGGRMEVVHPPKGWQIHAPDNARSVVANVVGLNGEDGLLLTGDLEGVGLFEVAEKPRPRFETMLSPHHGGRTANPPWFFKWAEPKRVIASQKKPTGRDALSPLEAQGVTVDRTWKAGVISLPIGAPHSGPSPSLQASLWPTGLRAILTLFGALFGLALSLGWAVIEWGAWTLVMPGRRLAGSAIEPPPWQPIDVMAKDGAKLHGSRLHATSSSGTIVFLHGFGEDRSAMRGRAESLHAQGWTVAVLDTRGRGYSEGDRTTFGGREADDLHAWLDVLSEATQPIIAWGRSMGAAIAARAAVEDSRISAVILEAPYADLRDAVAAWIASMKLPRGFALPILWRAQRLAGVALHEPKPIAVAPRVEVPVLILHGTADTVVSPLAVNQLAAAFRGTVEVIEIEGAGHRDVFDRGGVSLIEQIAAWAARAYTSPQGS